MTDKRTTYQSNLLALPPLKMVLGEIPEPDPENHLPALGTLGEAKSATEARELVQKLIGHLISGEK